MSSHVVVIATDLRRITIKVSPGTYLIDVLHEACKKLNLPGDRYILRHKQKQVDLSVPLRASGLLPGAKLELVQNSNTPSAVQIALQIPQPEAKEIPGGRLIRKFPSDLTLWKVLRQFESGDASAGRNLNITARGVARGLQAGRGSGQLCYETPVLNIMGRELSSFADFQKTLSQLGHNSGSVLIRLSYRTTDQTLLDAMEQISRFFNDEAQVEKAPDSKVNAETNGEAATQSQHAVQPVDTVMPDAAPVPLDTSEARHSPAQQPPIASATPEPHREAVADGESTSPRDPYQPINVFLAPTGSAPAAALAQADEEDFAPTVAHAQLHQARLLESSRNKRLLSDKELEDKAAAEAARIAAIKSVLVKVRFPDNTSSEWQIGPQETGAFLYEAVRQIMAERGLAFRLVLPGDKTVVQDKSGPAHSLIKGYKLSGRVLINLVWGDDVPHHARNQPFLKANVAQRGQAVKVPELPDVQDNEATSSLRPQPTQVDRGEGKADGGGKKIPKWLKLGKK